MRIAIVGAGGLGGYYGARLAEAGHQVAFIARGEQLAAMQTSGLKVLSPLGDVTLDRPQVSDDPNDLGTVDAVLLAVKTWQVRDVARRLQPLLHETTVVVPFLNGVEASDHCIEVLGDGRVLGGLSKIFSQIESPGVIRHMNPHTYVEIGELDGRFSDRVTQLLATFADAGVETRQSEDIRTALWKKLMLVASWSGIGAVARTPIGGLLGNSSTLKLVTAAMDEVFAVGRASGYDLPESLKEEMWTFYRGLPAQTSASMMRDIMEGKPSELEAWIGVIVRFAAQHQIAVPVSETVYNLLQPMEQRARVPA